MILEISVPIHDTESESKVKKAVKNLFPLIEVTVSEEGLYGTSNDMTSLDRLKELLEVQKIRSTAHTILKRSLSGDSLTFYLNKQAAFMGKVNFSEDCPLDPITVSLTGEDLPALIDHMSPTSSEQ
jgi:predicted RNA binding protein with dsRBD fold (UPF0201 family)